MGGVKLRLFGLGGSVVPHKLFDNGEGVATMAGGGGVVWTTALQIGEWPRTSERSERVREGGRNTLEGQRSEMQRQERERSARDQDRQTKQTSKQHLGPSVLCPRCQTPTNTDIPLSPGELVDTAQKVFDPTETRVLITHGSVGKEGLLSQIALALKADFTISASLHFRCVFVSTLRSHPLNVLTVW